MASKRMPFLTRAMDWWMMKIVFYPLNRVKVSQSPYRRVLWVIVFFVWLWPTFTVGIPLVLLGLFAAILHDAWHADRGFSR